MGQLETVRINVTTDASGDATTTTAEAFAGFLYSVELIDGDLADGVDWTLSCTGTPSGVDQTLMTITDGNADAIYYPRFQVHDNTGTGVTYDGTNEIYGAQAVFVGKLKLVVAQGGNAKTGGVIVHYERE